jgi:hypothetical protein
MSPTSTLNIYLFEGPIQYQQHKPKRNLKKVQTIMCNERKRFKSYRVFHNTFVLVTANYVCLR